MGLLWTGNNVGVFEASYFDIRKQKRKHSTRKKAWMFNTYVVDVKHLQIQVKTRHLYTRSKN